MKSATIITSGYPSEGRPVYVFVEQLVNKFIDLGVNINVISPQSLTHAIIHREHLLPRKAKYKTTNGNEYVVYRPYYISLADHFPKLEKKLNFYFNRHLKKILHKINSEVIYCHFWNSAKWVYNYTLTEHKPMFVACGEGDNAIEIMLEVMPKEELQRLICATTGVVSVSTENKRKCLLYGLANERNIIVLPNCVDDLLFHVSNNRDKRKELGVKSDDFLVMFVGSFIHRKGADRVSDAIKKLYDRKIKSIFVGRPFDHENVIPNCDGIVFKGTLNHSELPKYLNAADLFVLPTLKEGCCNAIVEALSCGIPVVSSNRPFNEDILNENNSIVIDPENIDEISNAIYVMKNDLEIYRNKKKYTIEHSNEYSISVRAQRIIDFIDNLVQRTFSS